MLNITYEIKIIIQNSNYIASCNNKWVVVVVIL